MKKFISSDTHHQTQKNISLDGLNTSRKLLTGKCILSYQEMIVLWISISFDKAFQYKPWFCIIFRFANTVTGQFYGHTHNDEFTMFYDYETNQIPVNIAFVTPSVTTFTGLNPSFRFYKLDGPYEGASMVTFLIIYPSIGL